MPEREPVLQALRGSGLDSATGAEFVQQRIALFAKLVAIIAFAQLVVGNGLAIALHGESFRSIFTHRGQLAHLCGTALAAGVWLVCRRGRYSLATLEWIDAVALVGMCTAWGMVVIPPYLEWLYTALLANTMTVLARAITVPSRAGRTLRLSALAYSSQLVLVWLWVAGPRPPGEPLLPVSMGIDQTVWAAAAVAIATITSRILYDLRRSVREANELGQYSLEEKLGTGGMGEVWRARHRFLVRPAAVKLIRPELLASGRIDPAIMLRRFEREARATAALRSPHTVQLYDFGQADDGTLFYVMEMLGGIDLERLVARYGPVPAERAIHILQQVCHSLYEAHQNGLIHRDVKPANIFVSCIGIQIDFVKVLDFGLVGLGAERPDGDDAKLTAEGSIAATPAYAAPEIVLGEGYDHRVDIYAVGCVGHWLLTGKLVFEGDTPMKMMMEHARTPPSRPQTRTELPIPPELEQIILDCLEKDPARRPATTAELASRLREVKLAQGWTAERAERWWRAHLPQQVSERPAADMLLSHEASPADVRELRRRRAVRTIASR